VNRRRRAARRARRGGRPWVRAHWNWIETPFVKFDVAPGF
jgi:hypothetical protein